jgi:hypothetical protein
MDSKVKERLPSLEQLLLMRCANMVNQRKVCPDSPIEEMVKVIGYSHEKGYLYTNRQANTFVCGYRIPELSEKWKSTIPEKEEGEIFFVNFAVSEEPNKWVLLKMLREYLKANTDVKELVYFRRNNDKDFKRIHLRRPI